MEGKKRNKLKYKNVTNSKKDCKEENKIKSEKKNPTKL